MLEPGLEGVVERTVTEDMTAEALGSGDVPVLATPVVLALMEAAACRAIEGYLDEEQTSVGISAEFAHRAPTVVGSAVRATARLTEVVDRLLVFRVSVGDPAGEVAAGTHKRTVVGRARFLAGARKRAGT